MKINCPPDVTEDYNLLVKYKKSYIREVGKLVDNSEEVLFVNVARNIDVRLQAGPILVYNHLLLLKEYQAHFKEFTRLDKHKVWRR